MQPRQGVGRWSGLGTGLGFSRGTCGVMSSRIGQTWQRRPWRVLLPLNAATSVPEREAAWDKLGWNLHYAGSLMYKAVWTEQGGWNQGELVPYGPLKLDPAAAVFSLGQAMFEGMKVLRSEDGRVLMFRPELNARRMAAGAERLCMPPVPEEQFLEAAEQVVRNNAYRIPPSDKGQLYLRPVLFGSGPRLSLGPAQEYTFTLICAAVGSYFKGGFVKPVSLLVDYDFNRAAPCGVGWVKAAGNYSPCIIPKKAANAQGYDDILCVDAKTNTYLEEVSASNIFVVFGDTLKTPGLEQGTFLEGVTRGSIVQLARDLGYKVKQGPITVDEAMLATEVFACGTGVGITPVGRIKAADQVAEYCQSLEECRVTSHIYTELTGIQRGEISDRFNWLWEIKGL